MGANKKIEIILIVLLYLTTLYIWALPFKDNKLPYGEVDAASHFTLGDYMAQTDQPIFELPYFIDNRYGFDNEFVHHRLWYHPPYHVNFAVAQIIGGERIVPIFLLNAILSSIIVLVSYFVIRKLFGFWPAFLSSFLLAFSLRDILTYLWGQWPERIGYYFTPLILYCAYRYMNSFLDKKEKPSYICILAILLGINFFMHPIGGIHSVTCLAVFTAFLWIKEKRFPANLKHLSFSIVLFLLMVGIFPLQTGNVIYKMIPQEGVTRESGGPTTGNIGRLFHWYKKDPRTTGVPDAYFSYSASLGTWTFPLLLVGIAFVSIRRKRKDLLLLGYLVGIYIMTHLDFIGMGRSHRSLSATAHIFFPLIAIGLMAIPQFIGSLMKLSKEYRAILKFSLIIVFLLLGIFFNAKPAYMQLKNAYGGFLRINDYQQGVSEWMGENLPIEANITVIGPVTQQKARWMRHIAWRYVYHYLGALNVSPIPTHAVVDYSDYYLIGDRNRIAQLEAWEKENLGDSKILIVKNNIKVYELGQD